MCGGATFVDPSHQPFWKLFAAAEDIGKRRDVEGTFHKVLEHGGHEVDRGYLPPLDKLPQISGFLVRTRERNDEFRANRQGPEKLPNRHVKSEWCFLYNPVSALQAIG